MSVRAYKLIEVKHAKTPTFNCWHDKEIFNLANTSNECGGIGGITTFYETEVSKKLKELKNVKKKTEIDEDNIKILKQIIKDMDGDTYVDYYCF